MKVFTTTLISLIISVYSATAVFADINLKHIEYFEGTCKILVIEDKELECGENFFSSLYKNGIGGFWFIGANPDYSLFTFSGDTNFEIQSDEKFIRPIHAIVTEFGVSEVEGKCVYQKLSNEKLSIECSALNPTNNLFKVQFLTDGELPKVISYD